FTGTASFTYTITDSSGSTSTATAFVNIPVQLSVSDTFPAQPTTGVHLFGMTLAANPFNDLLAGFYSTTGPDPANEPGNNPNGPYALTLNISPFDPFLLPSHTGTQSGDTESITLPSRSFLALPNIAVGNSISTEGLAVRSTQIGTHNVIEQILITPNPALGPN